MSDPNWITGVNLSNYLAIDGDFMYLTQLNNTISKIQISTQALTLNWISSGLAVPTGIVINGDYMYVGNQGTETIFKIQISTATIVDASWATGLNSPNSLVISNGYIYVTNGFGNSISKIDILTGGVAGTWISGTITPTGLAINGDYMYVCDISNDTISRITISTISLETGWASGPTGGGLISLIIDSLYIYITNSNLTTISQLLLADGSMIDPNFITGLSGPYDITIKDNFFYVINFNSGVIGKYFNGPPPPAICFKEDTKILTDKGYRLIQDLRKGDLVKTLKHDFVPINMIGKSEINNPSLKERIKDQLYKCSNEQFPEVFEPLIITGCHSILITNCVTPKQIEQTKEVLGGIYITDDKFRYPACIDERTTVYEVAGKFTIYHIALDHDNYRMNYGIYANGLLVETCSKRYLKELSNMTLIE